MSNQIWSGNHFENKTKFGLCGGECKSFGCHQNGLRCQRKHFETSWLDRATSVSDDTNAFWKNSTRSIPCGHSERNSFLPNDIYIYIYISRYGVVICMELNAETNMLKLDDSMWLRPFSMKRILVESLNEIYHLAGLSYEWKSMQKQTR